jgi:hypothetical protein
MTGAAIIIPIRENGEEITSIANKAKDVLEQDHGIKVRDPEAVWTVAYKTLEETVKWISDNKKSDNLILNFFDLFDIGVTYRESDESEKDGNFTPFLKINDEIIEKIRQGKKLVSKKEDDDDSKLMVTVEPSTNRYEIEQIANNANLVLKENHHIRCGTGKVATTITVVFVKEIFNWLMKNTKPGTDTILNLCQLIDFGITYIDDDFTPSMVAGQEFKLIIKNDEQTEDDD